MLIVPHSPLNWRRRARPPIHQLGRVDNIHGQIRQNLPAKRAARRTRSLVWTGLYDRVDDTELPLCTISSNTSNSALIVQA